MLASKIDYSARNSADRIYPNLMASRKECWRRGKRREGKQRENKTKNKNIKKKTDFIISILICK